MKTARAAAINGNEAAGDAGVADEGEGDGGGGRQRTSRTRLEGPHLGCACVDEAADAVHHSDE
jgi:hypothetical protein